MVVPIAKFYTTIKEVEDEGELEGLVGIGILEGPYIWRRRTRCRRM